LAVASLLSAHIGAGAMGRFFIIEVGLSDLHFSV